MNRECILCGEIHDENEPFTTVSFKGFEVCEDSIEYIKTHDLKASELE